MFSEKVSTILSILPANITLWMKLLFVKYFLDAHYTGLVRANPQILKQYGVTWTLIYSQNQHYEKYRRKKLPTRAAR